MQKDSEVEVSIETTGFGGDGIGRLDGMVVFVRGALPGETVRVRLTEVRKRFAKGELLQVQTPAPQRQAPDCPLAVACPGCSYQHVAYPAELAYKQEQLEGLLAKLGGLQELPLLEPIGASKPEGYRNKIVLHSDGEGALGYYGFDNRTVLDVPCCPLAVPAIQEALPDIRAKSAGRLQQHDSITVRWTAADGVLYWTNQHAPRSWLTECDDRGPLQVPAGSFWQVNPGMLPKLLDIVRGMIQSCEPEHVLDLYCGAGLFALAAADGVKHVLGVEMQREAIRAARANAASRKLSQVLFAAGDSASLYPEAMGQVDGETSLLIVDPPREGLSKKLSALLGDANRPGPRNLLYISCAADTLARDLKRLCADAYQVVSIQLLDLFPRTAHFETIVLLERRSAG